MSPGLGEVGTKSLPVQNHCMATPRHSDYIQLIGSPLCGVGEGGGVGWDGGEAASAHPWPSLSPVQIQLVIQESLANGDCGCRCL